MQIEKFNRMIAAICASVAILFVTACGGGSSDNGPCGGPGTLSLSLGYNVNGLLYDSRSSIVVNRNLPLTAQPVAVGLPPACAGKLSWRVRVNSSGLPTGLVLDETTGQISGTATTSRSFGVTATAFVEGYPGSLSDSFTFLLVAN
jgi:hypothetical protein